MCVLKRGTMARTEKVKERQKFRDEQAPCEKSLPREKQPEAFYGRNLGPPRSGLQQQG